MGLGMPVTVIVGNFKLRRVRLELAREPEHPLGSHAVGYEIVAPLSADGRLDVDGWRLNRERCRAVRLRPGADHVVGRLLRRPGGSWALRFGGEADEVGVRFGEERFERGDYVTLNIDGDEHTFRVISVEPI
jgi:hypothetical protein